MSKSEKLIELLQDSMGLRVDAETAESMLRVAQSRGESGYVQWMSRDGQTFSPASLTSAKLTPGLYEIGCNMNSGIFFDKLSVSTEGLIRLPDTASDAVIEEIQNFWGKELLFRQFNINYKRGILLWGPPGSGKTATVRIVCNDVIKRGGVVLKFWDANLSSKGIRLFRDIQPETPCVVLMEDLDSILKCNMETEVINTLDGIDKVDKVLFLATTNYPELLGDRVVNRPSRFDRRYFIGPPNEKSRELFFTYLLSKAKTNIPPEEIKTWVVDTDGMSIAHLKELFVARVILGTPYKQAIEILRNMEISPSSEDYSGKNKRAAVMQLGPTEGYTKPDYSR
jgi:hypothetical protein